MNANQSPQVECFSRSWMPLCHSYKRSRTSPLTTVLGTKRSRDNIPVLQEDIAFHILEHCRGDASTLRACALVHSRWLSPARSSLFSTLSREGSRVILSSKALFAVLPVIAPHVRRFKLLSYSFKGDRVNPRLRPFAHALVLLAHLAATAPVLALGVTDIELEDCHIEHDFLDLATFFSPILEPRFVVSVIWS
jgi:hypothetical protein